MNCSDKNLGDLPQKIVRYDTLRIEYGKSKMCDCHDPHYEIDYQNRLVYCQDCGAVVDPLEALIRIARDTERWSEYTEQLLEHRRQIADYHPRRVVLKKIEHQYIGADRNGLEPTCPHCRLPFQLEELLNVSWVNPEFASKLKGESKE